MVQVRNDPVWNLQDSVLKTYDTNAQDCMVRYQIGKRSHDPVTGPMLQNGPDDNLRIAKVSAGTAETL
jgi:hypothetical protein